jgi:hypothetical protein
VDSRRGNSLRTCSARAVWGFRGHDQAGRHGPDEAEDDTFEDEDRTMSGKAMLSYDNVNWDDDIEITYRRLL